MNWIHDPAPPAPRRAAVDYSDTPVQSSDTPVQSRDTHVKSLDTHVKSRDPLCLLVIPRRPPLPLTHHRELLSPCLIPRSQGEGGEGTAAQPMRIQRPSDPG